MLETSATTGTSPVSGSSRVIVPYTVSFWQR